MQTCDGRGRVISWANLEMYDISGCCATSNMFFFLMQTLFWYRPYPTNLEAIVWFLYWIFTLAWGYAKVHNILDFNKTLRGTPKIEPEKVGEEGAVEAVVLVKDAEPGEQQPRPVLYACERMWPGAAVFSS